MVDGRPISKGRFRQYLEIVLIDGSTNPPYVGAIPGLAALDGLGADAGPAAVLGSDVLRQRECLVLRGGKVYV